MATDVNTNLDSAGASHAHVGHKAAGPAAPTQPAAADRAPTKPGAPAAAPAAGGAKATATGLKTLTSHPPKHVAVPVDPNRFRDMMDQSGSAKLRGASGHTKDHRMHQMSGLAGDGATTLGANGLAQDIEDLGSLLDG